MAWRRRRQKVGGLEKEFLIDTHGAGLGDFQEANQGPEVLTQAEQLVGLQAQAPFGMGETIIDGRAHIVRGLQRALIHGLQQEMGEVEMLERGRLDLALRIDELQLIA